MKKIFSKEMLINKFSFYLLAFFPFIKTPIINTVKKNKIVNHYHKKNYSFFTRIILRIFWGYYAEITDEKISRSIFFDVCLKDQIDSNEYVEFYYQQNNLFKIYDKNWFISNLPFKEANPIFDKTIEFIKRQKFDPKNIYLIQIGSCSGRDIEFLKFNCPQINYISTDISDTILNFQKNKYNDNDIKYFKCYADKIDECISFYKIQDKKIIIFAHGSIHLIPPFGVRSFFDKISKYNDLTIISLQTINKYFIKNSSTNDFYMPGNNFLFSYKYDMLAKEFNLHIIENKNIDLWKESENKSKATIKNLFIATTVKNN